MFLTYYVIDLVSRTFDHICVEKARYKFLIIFIIYIYIFYINIGNRKKTTLSSRQACFVIAHSSGDLMIRTFITIGYILLDYIVGENLNLNV